MNLATVTLLWCITSYGLYAQNTNKVIEGWEPGEEQSVSPAPKQSTALLSLFSDVSSELITLYQQDISPRSIQRCPFKISCSHFAATALERFGVFGMCLFIDRYFYRENGEAYLHYPLIVTVQQTLKLDDAFFLEE